MSGWGVGGYGTGPWGGGIKPLKLIREFQARNSNPNEISLTWKKPENYDPSMELIIVRRKDSFPMELFNSDSLYLFKQNVSGFTDPVQVEIFRGRLIRGSGTGEPGKFTDGSASFPTSPSLKGRILRDSTSHNFKIISNTATEIFVSGTPVTGQYVVLVDFPNSNEQAITGTSTAVGAGYLRDTTKSFVESSLSDRILVDQGGNRFVIYDNTDTLLSVSGTPVSGDYIILQEFNDYISPSDTVKSQFSYIDTFLNKEEADLRTGSGLEDEQFYYYTAFTHRASTNIAQSVYSAIDTVNSTQTAALSSIDRDFQQILIDYWPNVYKLVDTTGDFNDLMNVFGFGLNEVYSFVNTFDLENPDRMYYTVLSDMAKQTGISIADFKVGADELRRIISDIIDTWRKKGSKQGIVDFIRIITTWDATNGTGDASEIIDDIPNSGALRLYSDTLGSDNTRLFGFKTSFVNSPFVTYTYTPATGIIQYSAAVNLSNVQVGHTFEDGAGNIFDVLGVDDTLDQIEIDLGKTVDTSSNGNIYEKTALSHTGRFFKSLPGIVIPGFFNFSEFVVEIQDVALFVGESSDIQISGDTTTLTDLNANYGGVNNLVGNFLLPKQGQVNDIFEIISNTTTEIIVRGVVRDLEPVGDYAVLSPLNTARFQRLIELMKEFAPSKTRMGLQFTSSI